MTYTYGLSGLLVNQYVRTGVFAFHFTNESDPCGWSARNNDWV